MIYEFENKIIRFLSGVISEFNPDFVIPLERSATALIRALKRSKHRHQLNLPWSRIISSASLQKIKPKILQGKRLLLFDDIAYHGHTLLEAHETIISRIGKGSAVTSAAVFAVHQSCPPERRPDFAYFASADDAFLNEVRKEGVALMKRTGSLLLDTEHLEVEVNLTCKRQQFFEALALCGTPVLFSPAGDRVNCSLVGVSSTSLEETEQRFPGAVYKDRVCKCRAIQRTPSSFTLIPIAFPDVPLEPDDTWFSSLPEYVRDEAKLGSGAHFHITGIILSLEVLKTVCSAIRTLGDAVQISPPVTGDADPWLDHLLSLHPELKVEAIRQEILRMIDSPPEVTFHDEKKEIQTIRAEEMDELYDIIAREIWRWTEIAPEEANGAEYRHILRVAEIAGESAAKGSAALDKLIDDGMVKPDDDQLERLSGEEYFIRVFRPDGEGASAKISVMEMLSLSE